MSRQWNRKSKTENAKKSEKTPGNPEKSKTAVFSKSCESNTENKECPVCMTGFSTNDHRLKLLVCAHEVCVRCVKEIDKCPICQGALEIIDFQTVEFVKRRGFDCLTCETSQTSDKMRICITCAEAGGILVKPEKIRECSPYIFCSECIIEDHMYKGHVQEKLINYDAECKTIREMQKTCLRMKPVLERIQSSMDQRAANYRKLTKVVDLVLCPDVDINFLKLYAACSTLQKCVKTVNREAEVHRNFQSNCNELDECFAENVAELIRNEEFLLAQRMSPMDHLNEKQKKVDALEKVLSDTKQQCEQNERELRNKIALLRDESTRLIEKNERHERNVILLNNSLNTMRNDEKEKLLQQNELQNKITLLREESSRLAERNERHEKNIILLNNSLTTLKNDEKERLLQQVIKHPVYVERLSEICWKVYTVEPSHINNFYISVNRTMYLCALELYGTYETGSGASVTIGIQTRTGTKKSIQEYPVLKHSGPSSRVNLNNAVQLTPGCKYLLELRIDRKVCVYNGKNGKNTYELPGYPGCVVEISDGNDGSHSTVSYGQFAGFYFAVAPDALL